MYLEIMASVLIVMSIICLLRVIANWGDWGANILIETTRVILVATLWPLAVPVQLFRWVIAIKDGDFLEH
jgi:hypothetical protein